MPVHVVHVFGENAPFIERYQRFSKEWNQVIQIRSIKAKTFKEAAEEVLGISLTIVIRLFKQLVKTLPSSARLPRAIAIDESKADTDAGKYLPIIADAETHEFIGSLPTVEKKR